MFIALFKFLLHCSSLSGHIKEQVSGGESFERKDREPSILGASGLQRDYIGAQNPHLDRILTNVRMHFEFRRHNSITSVMLI